jgi:hypothetical protein
MDPLLSPDVVAALMQAQGHAVPAGTGASAAADAAAFASRALLASRAAFDALAFEDEPARWSAVAREAAR